MVDRKIREKEMSTKLAEIGSLSEIQVGGETDISDEVIAAIAGVAARGDRRSRLPWHKFDTKNPCRASGRGRTPCSRRRRGGR